MTTKTVRFLTRWKWTISASCLVVAVGIVMWQFFTWKTLMFGVAAGVSSFIANSRR